MLTTICQMTFVLIFSLLFGADVGIGKDQVESAEKSHPFGLYLTHGVSSLDASELERLSVASYAFSVGPGFIYDLTSDISLNAEFLLISASQRDTSDHEYRMYSRAITKFRQDRLTLGGSYKKKLAKNFVFFPEIGMSLNRIEVILSEGSYYLETSEQAVGWYTGIGSMVPIKRVFFDFRYKYQALALKMEKLGVDQTMFQSTFLIGFGFVI
jgi:hypothetical protein